MMTTSTTIGRRGDFSLLPDLPLLEVFANLSLVDLFTRVPLVCRNWSRIQPVALARRKHLYIGSPERLNLRLLDDHILPATGGTPPVVVAINEFDVIHSYSALDWCSISRTHSRHASLTTDVRLNTLPPVLPPLAAPDTLAHYNAMPLLTELTVVDTEAEVLSNLARLLAHLTSTLRVLRLEHYVEDEEEETTTAAVEFDRLIGAVNTLHQLRSLHLHLGDNSNRHARIGPLSTSGGLSPTLLGTRLRSLVLINCRGKWLRQLISPNTISSLPDNSPLEILALGGFVFHASMHRFLATTDLAPRVRLLNAEYDRRFIQLPYHRQIFPGLRALALSYAGNERAQYHQVLAELAAGGGGGGGGNSTADDHQLASLSIDICDDNAEYLQLEQPHPPPPPVLPWVRHLTLYHLSWSPDHPVPGSIPLDHVGVLTRLLHLGQCFPRLERLQLQIAFGLMYRVGCCSSRKTQYQMDQCRRAVLRTLATDCPNLTTLELNLRPGIGPQVYLRNTDSAAAAGAAGDDDQYWSVQYSHKPPSRYAWR